ncbi:hypothetical protein DESPIGER_1347 [Desulfovibrio piger]|uniref:Uncharacterized protein n=1 Tax=Desulfovibrio piger TaxID=901 RepID=A0A1K1LEQ1_9BACT|nr:hypothetical protein DESPIGER_1347 [Desulfovibrio piger]
MLYIFCGSSYAEKQLVEKQSNPHASDFLTARQQRSVLLRKKA